MPDALGFSHIPPFSQLLDHHQNLWGKKKVPVSGLLAMNPGKPGDICGPSELKRAFIPSTAFPEPELCHTQPRAKRYRIRGEGGEHPIVFTSGVASQPLQLVPGGRRQEEQKASTGQAWFSTGSAQSWEKWLQPRERP